MFRDIRRNSSQIHVFLTHAQLSRRVGGGLPVELVTSAADEVAMVVMVVVGGARGRRVGSDDTSRLGEASRELGLSFILAKSAVLGFSCGAALSAEPGSGR